jgi:hypothetical protein
MTNHDESIQVDFILLEVGISMVIQETTWISLDFDM